MILYLACLTCKKSVKIVMSNIEIFNSEVFNLPKSIDSDYFPDFVSKTLNRFTDELLLFDGELSKNLNKFLPNIQKLCTQINKSIDKYYLGDTVKAYNQLGAGLKEVESFLTTRGTGVSRDSTLSLYRSRIGGNKIYSNKEMFHIPFELRDRVTSQRFSIPGLPCLYLGNSAYICWEEMGKPDINTLQVSRIDVPRNKLKLLDFAITPSQINYIFTQLNDKETEDEWLLNYLVKWPIIFTSTLKTTNRNSSFKPEYIIPQLLLQWISNNKDLDGIVYFSSRIDTDFKKYMGSNINYVIPVKTNSRNGFCIKLKNYFKITEPVSWQLINIGKPNYAIKHADTELEKWIENSSHHYPQPTYLEIIKGSPQNYHETIFGLLEITLSNSKAKKI